MSGAVCVQRGFRVSVPAGFGEACGLAAGVAAACDDGIEDHAGCGEGNAEVERESLLRVEEKPDEGDRAEDDREDGHDGKERRVPGEVGGGLAFGLELPAKADVRDADGNPDGDDGECSNLPACASGASCLLPD